MCPTYTFESIQRLVFLTFGTRSWRYSKSESLQYWYEKALQLGYSQPATFTLV